MPDNILDKLDQEFENALKDLEKLEDDEELEASDPTDDDTDVEEDEIEEELEESSEDSNLGDVTFQSTKDRQKEKDAAAFKEMREQQAKLKKELEEKERMLEQFQMMSKSAGYSDANQLLEQWQSQQLEQEAKNKGIPTEVIRQMEEQRKRLEKLEQEKQALEKENKQKTVVQQIDGIVSELKLTQQEADQLVNNMGADGVTWEQLLVLPPAAIRNAVKGYATPIILEKERQDLIKKQQQKDGFQEDRIKGKKTKAKTNNPFSKESLEQEIAEYRKKNFPYLK
jgi:hypothetical protein